MDSISACMRIHVAAGFVPTRILRVSASLREEIPNACITESGHGEACLFDSREAAKPRREPAVSALWQRRVRREPWTQ